MNNIIIERACTGMFSDELDKMGLRNQVISGLHINNINGRIYGKVRTLKIETIDTADENIKLGLSFLGKLFPGEILCVEGSHEFAYFGELMTRLSLRQKIGGVIIGGLTRDSSFTQVVNNLSIFSEGYSPKDIKGRGRVCQVDAEIIIRGIKLSSNDWIFGDNDGIVVIPANYREQLENKILQLIYSENDIANDINKGVTVEEIINKYKEF